MQAKMADLVFSAGSFVETYKKLRLWENTGYYLVIYFMILATPNCLRLHSF